MDRLSQRLGYNAIAGEAPAPRVQDIGPGFERVPQKWNLIGLHHAGGLDIPKLNNKPGTYAANEGIRIQAIRTALEQ